MADNIKRISQRTGEFIAEDSSEPGFTVNMDDDGAQAFIDKIKATNPAAGSTAPSEPEAAGFPEPVTTGVTATTATSDDVTFTQTAPEQPATVTAARTPTVAPAKRTTTKARKGSK